MLVARRVRTFAVIAVAVTAAGGCSTGVDDGDTTQAGAAVRTLLALCAQGRGTEAEHVLTTPARAAFIEGADVRDGCERVIGLVPAGESATLSSLYERARVADVRVTGGIAEVDVVGPNGWRTTVEAEDHGDEWRVTKPDLPA